jgi:hypothetical protein
LIYSILIDVVSFLSGNAALFVIMLFTMAFHRLAAGLEYIPLECVSGSWRLDFASILQYLFFDGGIWNFYLDFW